MKIINHTRWRTADIKALATRVAAEELNPGQLRHITIEVFTQGANDANRDRYVRRVGSVLGTGLVFNYFTLKLPAVDPTMLRQGFRPGWDRAYVGVQLAHEMAECRGKKHKDMKGCSRYGYRVRGGARYGAHWEEALKDLPLRWDPPVKVERIPPTVEQKQAAKASEGQKRLEHARRMVATWQKRRKLTDTYLKKWTRRLRALERHHSPQKEVA